MKVVKNFEEFIEEGIVRRITPDKQRAQDLALEAVRKYALLKRMLKLMKVDDENANDYIESCYNIIMLLIRKSMLNEGYSSSGQGAHEAEVAFCRIMDLNESQIILLDQLRYFRNGILYYGKRFDAEYANKIIGFTNQIFRKLNNS